jgi:hypothetical protein
MCKDDDFWQLSWGAFKNLCQKNKDRKEKKQICRGSIDGRELVATVQVLRKKVFKEW